MSILKGNSFSVEWQYSNDNCFPFFPVFNLLALQKNIYLVNFERDSQISDILDEICGKKQDILSLRYTIEE